MHPLHDDLVVSSASLNIDVLLNRVYARNSLGFYSFP